MKRERLESAEQLKYIITEFRRNNRSAQTNYIPDPVLHRKWAESGKTFVHSFENGLYISYDNGFMMETVFISGKPVNLRGCLREISMNYGKPTVLERVYRKGKDQAIGTPDYILRRMSRNGVFESHNCPSERVVKATLEDIPKIQEVFSTYFNPLTERIPDEEELSRLIDNKWISVIRKDNEISGMVIYEKDKSNIHLRYWWVSPDQRGMGVGADLLRDYFCSGKGSTRQFLWVFSNNTDAIDKYRHYGFEFDGVEDEIYIER